jgi:DNA-binding transcriptional regulator GbsR (MarR family)
MEDEHKMINSETSPELQDLADQVGEFMHYWGFKRIHGKIWTHLFLSGHPLDASELIQRLKISKALVSISIRELIDFSVVKEAGRSTRSTQLYKVNPDVGSVITSVLRQREKRIIGRVLAAHAGLKSVVENKSVDSKVNPEAFEKLGVMVSEASQNLDSLISMGSIDFGAWKSAFQLCETLFGFDAKKNETADDGAIMKDGNIGHTTPSQGIKTEFGGSSSSPQTLELARGHSIVSDISSCLSPNSSVGR